MKSNIFTTLLALWLTAAPADPFAQVPVPPGGVARVPFTLHNTLGYHRMFLVEGPGMKYGFTMNRREHMPCNWPVGSKLYFSQDGETPTGYILTVSANDAGKTLTTDAAGPAPKEVATRKARPENAALAGSNEIAFRLRNPGLLPRKVAIIYYQPGAVGNGTVIQTFAPKWSTRFRFQVGTKVYLADDAQVNTVMSGKRIDTEKPFLIVRPGDAGRTFDID